MCISNHAFPSISFWVQSIYVSLRWPRSFSSVFKPCSCWDMVCCMTMSMLRSFSKDRVTSAASRLGPSTSGYEASAMCSEGEQGDEMGAFPPGESLWTSHSSTHTCLLVEFHQFGSARTWYTVQGSRPGHISLPCFSRRGLTMQLAGLPPPCMLWRSCKSTKPKCWEICTRVVPIQRWCRNWVL